MTLKRTTVYAESEDLAAIKEAAARQGISEAEIIREAIHLAALANRVWEEPFFTAAYRPVGDGSIGIEEVWAERARAYEATKQSGE